MELLPLTYVSAWSVTITPRAATLQRGLQIQHVFLLREIIRWLLEALQLLIAGF